MSNEQIKAFFEKQLEKSQWWKRLSGSQFLNGLSTFISQIIHRNTRANENALSESFLSLAINRSSVLAGAEDKGHVGLKISPSSGRSIIENTGSERVSLPATTPIMSKSLVYYIIDEAIDLDSGENQEIGITQLWLEEIVTTVENPEAWMSYLLSVDTTAKAHRVDVYVDNELWENRFKFRNTDEDSKVYMEFYKSTEQLGFRFGDGIKGMIPEDGAEIRLEVWCTDGDTTLIDGQSLQLIGDYEYLNNDITITTLTPITGGAEAEDTETTRSNALYTTAYDDQIVWGGDYHHYIRNNVAGVVWLSVWGEKEQERLVGVKRLDHINQIYITAYSDIKGDIELGREILALFTEQTSDFNIEYQYVAKKEDPYTVAIAGYVFPHSSTSDAEKRVIAKLTAKYGKDVKNKPHRVYQQDIWDLVNDLVLETGIDEFTVTTSNLPTDIPVDTYSFLDLDASTISFEYREAD